MSDGPHLPPGIRLVRFGDIDSTNDEARRQAEAGAPAGLLICADRQSLGRGRRGRTWDSPAGNLYTSLLLRPTVAPAIAAQLSFVTALAVADAVRAALPGGPVISCKWPNDVLVGGAKISGILLESGTRPDGRLDWLVVGVGINLASHPVDTAYPATSIQAQGGQVERDVLLSSYVAAFHRWMYLWQEQGFAPIRTAWLGRADGLGHPVVVKLAQDSLHGIFSSLNAVGALLLQLPSGEIRTIAAGDVFRAA